MAVSEVQLLVLAVDGDDRFHCLMIVRVFDQNSVVVRDVDVITFVLAVMAVSMCGRCGGHVLAVLGTFVASERECADDRVWVCARRCGAQSHSGAMIIGGVCGQRRAVAAGAII